MSEKQEEWDFPCAMAIRSLYRKPSIKSGRVNKPTPQTPEDWYRLTGLYEAAMLKDKETISELKEEVNKLRQKLKNSHRVPNKYIEAMRRKAK